MVLQIKNGTVQIMLNSSAFLYSIYVGANSVRPPDFLANLC